MKTLKTTLLAFFVLGSTSIIAQDFDDFDTDKDGRWSQDEFVERSADAYDEVDVNRDGKMDADEFAESTFNVSDKDQDDFVNKEEWRSTADLYGSYMSTNGYLDYDTDRDDKLNRREWNESIGESGWFDTYDTNKDKFLDEKEYNEGAFNDWDVNNDGYVDEDEYSSYNTDTDW